MIKYIKSVIFLFIMLTVLTPVLLSSGISYLQEKKHLVIQSDKNISNSELKS